ncbi:hypothetical protein C8F04DRAFT_1173450 [Mycena alexandri]|uniref:Uncharacterized protein n=1 Tax=Mycena alexandri TaxID=1745969 RepID=A0AAD6XAM2_9AGAR|nr:hypothetical protein C8F04DRAFT_1173450 [Mycena alexandri]
MVAEVGVVDGFVDEQGGVTDEFCSIVIEGTVVGLAHPHDLRTEFGLPVGVKKLGAEFGEEFGVGKFNQTFAVLRRAVPIDNFLLLEAGKYDGDTFLWCGVFSVENVGAREVKVVKNYGGEFSGVECGEFPSGADGAMGNESDEAEESEGWRGLDGGEGCGVGFAERGGEGWGETRGDGASSVKGDNGEDAVLVAGGAVCAALRVSSGTGVEGLRDRMGGGWVAVHG